MMTSLRVREYVEAANLAHQRARSERNPRAKQCCKKLNDPTIVWLKWKSGWLTSNNITVHLLISGCSTGAMRGRVSPCARTLCPQITAQKHH